ncbi:hypothetical protein L218DRAFT_948322 [Marasmius fiardii PR-910]|nr:hypothetical protein L218DRAFT_948322 [Marasmius fiardii PR-910]
MGLTLMSGTYFTWNHNADVVMDLKGGNSTPGTPVIAWKQKPNEQASNQLWHVQEVATGTENTYTIMNDQTKAYLELSGGRDGNSIVCNTKAGKFKILGTRPVWIYIMVIYQSAQVEVRVLRLIRWDWTMNLRERWLEK